jgi:hypothetical protein
MFDAVVFDTLSLAFEEADLLPETGSHPLPARGGRALPDAACRKSA